ncbi:hypothetical protein [Mediterraneibacter sp. ICN-202921]|uniref:hypothetical protein n=1 Tax=Mediterraneibacter sp. ICN-202921 TaxID=3134657 RepID=UPI0030C1D642
MAKAWGKVFMAVFSYLYKYRPYMTAWVICCLGVGACESIKQHDIDALLACVIVMLVPTVIKKILLTISRIDGERNEYDEEFLRVAPKGRFINYINEYLDK